MHVELVPALIDQYRETFEGEVRPGVCWVVDGPPASALFGTLDALAAEQAFASPAPGGRSVAAHVAHLRFALDLTHARMLGDDPAPDWASSFELPPATKDSPAARGVAWDALRRELRRAYGAVLEVVQARRDNPAQDWPPILLAGLAAITAHNAYHLGAIRQIVRVLTAGGRGAS